MNQLTVVDRGGVKHPEIVTIDEAQNLLDQYGVGGTAVKVPNGVNLQKFLGRCEGGWYYDNAALSGTTGGPIKDMVYYTVINGGIPGNRAVVASSHGNNLWIAEIYGDVFRGWVTFARPDDVHNWIDTAIEQHESTVNHPYATETNKGFIEIASSTEAVTGTEATRAMTSLRTQNLLDTFGLGAKSVSIPAGTNLVTYFTGHKFGVFHIDDADNYTNAPPETVWGEIICTSHEILNYKSLIAVMANGTLYTASINAGSFTGWKKKIELGDLPIASTTQAGIVQLNNTVISTSVTQAGTANAVKIAYDKGVAADNNANTRVPSSRTVNGKALSSDITITAADVGAYTTAQTDSLINTRVPTSRRVNGKPLTSDITLAAGDVGAYTKAEVNALLNSSSTDIRLGTPQSFKERRANERMTGGVMTAWADYGGSNYWVVLRPMQINRGGVWALVPYTNT